MTMHKMSVSQLIQSARSAAMRMAVDLQLCEKLQEVGDAFLSVGQLASVGAALLGR